ncbi:MAG: CocE/NonD family hydrolase [Bacteroidota bacterium]|nr:CocE/NonD family hydrolase [Bacteroidota bacterium]
MKYCILCLGFIMGSCHLGSKKASVITSYVQKAYMVPMRDGVKLYTVVLSPADSKGPLPVLIQRTPYGADLPRDYDILKAPYLAKMAREEYIFVFQDIRGKFKSQGTFEMNRPLYHLADKTRTDESTDAYDAVDWLIKNIPGNNGKAGILGISYLGYTALDAVSDPHPALKASCPQASPADMFLGDDFHHNGAFRLSYGYEYSYQVENAKESNSDYPFPQFDLYDWYLHLGSLKNVNDKYYKNRIQSWNDFALHPNNDEFWKKQTMLSAIDYPQIPVMHVGGYYDQEDLNGPQIMYNHMEQKDSFNRNFLVLGPWSHGQWARWGADSLGKIDFENKTATFFQQLQKQWFDYWLKGIGDGKFAEANCFQTGSNQWKTYTSWPPKEAEIKRLYANADGSCSFSMPTSSKGSLSYVSDPAKPVPYRSQPIEATYGVGSRWRTWQVEDQRFVASRPDVLTFAGDSLQNSLTVTGDIKAHVFVSTTATDADMVVKLIDVYPDLYHKNLLMSGYQLPVAMEVFRGRFRKSFERPEPFVPNKPEEIVIDLHQVNHTFLKGHKLMIQVQSSWFPVIDRNPQKYVLNIFEAKDSDFIKATHTLYCNSKLATYIELPVMKE